jgi:hypothetical protein
MNRKWLVWGILVLLVASLLGCGATKTEEPAFLPAPQGIVMEAEKARAGDAGGAAWDEDNAMAVNDASTGIDITIDRKIIYNVYLHLIVKDTAATFDQIREMVAGMGGFVADSNTWKDGEQLRGTLTVRVPADDLQDALAQFRDLALDVESERMDSQDVTEEYVDLEARLVNLQRTESELLELLETRSATGRTSDILEVHRELTNIRAQIEQIQGRMKYLDNLSAMATVQITLTPDALLQPVVVAGWRPEGTAREAVRMLIRTLQFFADAIIVFVLLILPIIIVIAIPLIVVFFVIRAIWKRAKRRKQEKKIQAT